MCSFLLRGFFSYHPASDKGASVTSGWPVRDTGLTPLAPCSCPMPLAARFRAPIISSPLPNRRIPQHLAHEILDRTDAISENVQREPWWSRTSSLGGQQLLC